MTKAIRSIEFDEVNSHSQAKLLSLLAAKDLKYFNSGY